MCVRAGVSNLTGPVCVQKKLKNILIFRSHVSEMTRWGRCVAISIRDRCVSIREHIVYVCIGYAAALTGRSRSSHASD